MLLQGSDGPSPEDAADCADSSPARPGPAHVVTNGVTFRMHTAGSVVARIKVSSCDEGLKVYILVARSTCSAFSLPTLYPRHSRAPDWARDVDAGLDGCRGRTVLFMPYQVR